MASTLAPYVDGWFGSEQELTVIPKPIFPFLTNPISSDVYSRLYERIYQVQPKLFLPKAANRTSWTNLVTYSEQFDNAAWTKTNATITADAGTAPDGQTTLDKLLETVTNGEHSVSQAATVTAAVTEVSVFAVGGLTRTWIRVAFTDSAAATFSAFFNISSGYTGTASAGVTAIIVPLGNNQFRCVIRFTPAAGAGSMKVNVSTDGSTISYAGNTANGVYLWGGQVTTGTQTPYISTTTSTRAISAPDRDRIDPMAYLLEEEDPSMQTSETGTVRRLFGRIPKQQTLPDFRFITKPEIPGTFPQQLGVFIVFQPVPTVASYDAYAIKTVATDSGATSAFYPTGGTYTLTFDGDTTAAIDYNDTSGDVQSALNALTSISDRGNVTVSGSYNSAGGFTITFGSYAAATIATGSLTSTGSSTSYTVTLSNGGYTQSVNIVSGFGTQFTGGTFTITIFGQTTAAIAYNATAAQVQAALNLLTEVQERGNCTVTLPDYLVAFPTAPVDITNTREIGVPRELNFTINFANLVITANSASLTPGGAAAVPAITDGSIGRLQAITFTSPSATRALSTTTAHGIVGGDSIYVLADGVYYTDITAFTVTGTSSITLTGSASEGYSSATAITEIGRLTIDNYTPGIKQTRCNRVTDFYLIGVTPGISSISDIPLPTYQGDPASLLQAIFSGSTSINYEVGELVQWRGTPILERTIVTLNASQL